MASYYSQVEEAIKNNQKELAHLQDELKGLRTVEKDTPRESYQRQHAQILYHIDQEQRRLEENKVLLQNYDEARRAILELRETRENPEIEELRGMLATERDPQVRREILEELEQKEKDHELKIEATESRFQNSMAGLTDELASELKNSFLISDEQAEQDEIPTTIIESDNQDEIMTTLIDDQDEVTTTLIDDQDENQDITENTNPKEISVQDANNDISDERTQELQLALKTAEDDYSTANAEYNTALEMMMSVFEEERNQLENNGPFRTEEDLANFTSDYMRRKIEINEKLEAAKALMTRTRKKIDSLERKIESRVLLTEEAKKHNVDVDVYEKIKKTVEKKDVVSAVYDKKGLGEVSKKGNDNKEKYSQVTNEMVEQIIDKLKNDGIITVPVTATQGDINQNGGVNVNIIDTINIIYGTDIPVKAGDSRTTIISTDDKDNVHNNQRKKIKLRRVPHNGDEQAGKTPGKAPEDMEDVKPTITDDDSSIAPDNTEQKGPEKQPINPTISVVNTDGTYRLKKDQVIQDEPLPSRTGQPENDEKPKSTDMVVYDPNSKALVPVAGDDQKKGSETQTFEPRQLLYGPPCKEPTKEKVISEPKEPEKENKPKRTLLTILDELTDGLDLKAKDGKRYKASNIKVAESFKEELKSGNYLYNIVHLVPAIVKLPFNLIRKATGKIMMTAQSKKNIATLKKRFDKMLDDYKKTGDDTDLMTIFNEYRGNRVLQERFPTILNTLLDETMQKFALDKVSRINSELEQRYASSFVAIRELEAIDRKLADSKVSDKEKDDLRQYRSKLLKGQAENIAGIRSGYQQANLWLSGGAHGFSEDMKAATTKLSIVGKRFAKDNDLDHDLLRKQAQLERAEAQAIADGNDEMALRTFIQAETLLSSNTEIKGSIFGKRSTGKKYYSPLAEQLDYRDDPFIRDLFTTIAVASAAISTVQSIAQAKEQASIIAENQRRIANNNQKMDQVNQIGSDIASKRGTMIEGMQAQGMQDTLSGANEIERAILDKTDWKIGTGPYRAADQAGHSYFTNFYDGTKLGFDNIAQQYASGQITQAQAMQMISDLSSKTHQTFGQINEACLDILRPYAQTHPHIDLSGVQGAMEFLQANPDAISAMNQAMVDVTNAGDVLASMQLEQLIPLTTIPSNIRMVIVNGASTAALASNINNSMGAKKHTYGNSVTDMVDEYVEQRNSEQNATGKSNASGK